MAHEELDRYHLETKDWWIHCQLFCLKSWQIKLTTEGLTPQFYIFLSYFCRALLKHRFQMLFHYKCLQHHWCNWPTCLHNTFHLLFLVNGFVSIHRFLLSTLKHCLIQLQCLTLLYQSDVLFDCTDCLKTFQWQVILQVDLWLKAMQTGFSILCCPGSGSHIICSTKCPGVLKILCKWPHVVGRGPESLNSSYCTTSSFFLCEDLYCYRLVLCISSFLLFERLVLFVLCIPSDFQLFISAAYSDLEVLMFKVNKKCIYHRLINAFFWDPVKTPKKHSSLGKVIVYLWETRFGFMSCSGAVLCCPGGRQESSFSQNNSNVCLCCINSPWWPTSFCLLCLMSSKHRDFRHISLTNIAVWESTMLGRCQTYISPKWIQRHAHE